MGRLLANKRLKRVPADGGGGAAVDITTVLNFPAGAAWAPDDRIVFASGAISPLWIVDARGGTAEALTAPERGVGHLFPELLPDGRTLLFNEGGWIHAVDLESGRQTAVVQGAFARYAATGHLIVNRGTALLAAPFDAVRLELTGTLVPIVDGVEIQRIMRNAPLAAISRSGTLAHAPAARAYTLVHVTADGSERILGEELSFENPQFSPDGTRLVVAATRTPGEAAELWVYDLESGGSPSRLTFDGGRAPVWTPDGTAITYSHLPGDRRGIYVRPADGRGETTPILPISPFHWLVGWTPDAKTLAYGAMGQVAADGISRSAILAFADGTSRYVVQPGDIWGGRLSPDGRFLAYYSSDSGSFEVNVTPFPEGGTRWLIAEGGTDPSWSPDGGEMYYRSGNRLMAAKIDAAAGMRVLSHRVAMEPFSPPLYDDYDVHPDGRSLALVRPAGGSHGREITVVLNWFSELRSRLRQ